MCQNIDPCLLLCPRHGDLVLLTGLDLVCEGVAQGGVLTVHKDYQLQTRLASLSSEKGHRVFLFTLNCALRR